MSQAVDIRLELPDDLPRFHLPEGVQHRLELLLDQQDRGEPLWPTSAVRRRGSSIWRTCSPSCVCGRNEHRHKRNVRLLWE